MGRDILRDDQWARIKGFLPGKASDRGVTASDNRLFVEAVLWIARTSSPWRDLPKRFGNWHRVYVRYDRWSKKGVWARLAEAVADKGYDSDDLVETIERSGATAVIPPRKTAKT